VGDAITANIFVEKEKKLTLVQKKESQAAGAAGSNTFVDEMSKTLTMVQKKRRREMEQPMAQDNELDYFDHEFR